MIYLDYAASTPPDAQVMESFLKVSNEYYANNGAVHKLGSEAHSLYIKAKEQIARMLKTEIDELFFTSGATEANNQAIKGFALKYQERGKHLITSVVEHPSVYEAFKQLEEYFGFEVTYLKPNSQGIIEVEEVSKAIRKDTILVSLMHVNNEIGSITNIEEIGALLSEHRKIAFHVDLTQSIGKIDFDLRKMNIDMASFSSHKIYGLKSSGLLYKRKSIELLPLLSGGKQQGGLRAGTFSTAHCVATAKAIRIALQTKEEHYLYVKKLHDYVKEKISEIDNIVINTPAESYSPYILNFSVINIKPETFLRAMSDEGIYLSTKSACSKTRNIRSRVIAAITEDEKVISTPIRVSFSHHIKLHELETIVSKIEKNINKLRGI